MSPPTTQRVLILSAMMSFGFAPTFAPRFALHAGDFAHEMVKPRCGGILRSTGQHRVMISIKYHPFFFIVPGHRVGDGGDADGQSAGGVPPPRCNHGFFLARRSTLGHDGGRRSPRAGCIRLGELRALVYNQVKGVARHKQGLVVYCSSLVITDYRSTLEGVHAFYFVWQHLARIFHLLFSQGGHTISHLTTLTSCGSCFRSSFGLSATRAPAGCREQVVTRRFCSCRYRCSPRTGLAKTFSLGFTINSDGLILCADGTVDFWTIQVN